jgi:hypothetical protein
MIKMAMLIPKAEAVEALISLIKDSGEWLT